MVKLGNKYLCKRTNKGHDHDIGVEEGEWYEVVKIDGVPKGLEGIDIARFLQVSVGIFNVSFRISENKYNSTRTHQSDYFWDYFYTEKELRKKKLNKIKNGNSNSN